MNQLPAWQSIWGNDRMTVADRCARRLLKKLLLCTLLLLALSGVSAATAGQNLVVIVNARNIQALSTNDIRNIYSDRIITWANGRRIAVYQLPAHSPLKERFSRKILGLSAIEAAREESNRRITNMLRNPPRVQSPRAVARLVAMRPNAIGYVSRDLITGLDGVRIVMTVD